MSSYKLNDPAAPMYRRNYRTHLALDEDLDVSVVNEDGHCVDPNLCTNSIPGDDRAPLLSVTPQTSSTLTKTPIDHYNFVKYSFLLLGIVTLLPWNFFINASKVLVKSMNS